MQGEFITIDYLSSFAGLVAAVALIVQFTKPLVKWALKSQEQFFDEIIRTYTGIVAFVLQLFVVYVTSGFTVENVGLAAINAVAVGLLSIGLYHCFKINQKDNISFQ